MSDVKMPEPSAYAVMCGGDLYEVYSSATTAAYAASNIDGYLVTIDRLITTDQAEAYAAAKVREAFEQATFIADGYADNEGIADHIRALIK